MRPGGRRRERRSRLLLVRGGLWTWAWVGVEGSVRRMRRLRRLMMRLRNDVMHVARVDVKSEVVMDKGKSRSRKEKENRSSACVSCKSGCQQDSSSNAKNESGRRKKRKSRKWVPHRARGHPGYALGCVQRAAGQRASQSPQRRPNLVFKFEFKSVVRNQNQR